MHNGVRNGRMAIATAIPTPVHMHRLFLFFKYFIVKFPWVDSTGAGIDTVVYIDLSYE